MAMAWISQGQAVEAIRWIKTLYKFVGILGGGFRRHRSTVKKMAELFSRMDLNPAL